jgi:hypothetical protein
MYGVNFQKNMLQPHSKNYNFNKIDLHSLSQFDVVLLHLSETLCLVDQHYEYQSYSFFLCHGTGIKVL